MGGSNLEIKKKTFVHSISYTSIIISGLISGSIRSNSKENVSTLLFLHGKEKTELFKTCVAMYTFQSVVKELSNVNNYVIFVSCLRKYSFKTELIMSF